MPASTSVRQGVFISYSRKDGEYFAQRLRTDMAARHIPVWMDRTGMEGGRDWWEQIKEALNRVEFMVLVMTPAALLSDIVRKEWRYARQQGVCVYPVIADDGLNIGALPRWMSSAHWYDLKHQDERFYNDLNTHCKVRRVPFMAQAAPDDFVARSREFDELKTALLSGDCGEPVAITAALRGAGGFGKTTLAAALCQDVDIQYAFDDGILWVTLGEEPSPAALIGKLCDLIETLSGWRPDFEGLDAASARLSEELADRDVLLVIDDVWRSPDLHPFLTGGPRCARLITTRRGDLLPGGVKKIPVDQMTGGEAVQLLATGLPEELRENLAALAGHLGEWPLLLRLANGWLRKRIQDAHQEPVAALATLGKALTARGITALDARDPDQRNDAVAKTLALSFDGLATADQDRMLELAAFEEDLSIPLHVLEHYWRYTGGIDELEVEETCQRLFDHGLLRDFDLGERSIRLHDAIRAWLLVQAEATLPALHGQLLDSYRSGGKPWHQLADDGYLYGHLARHLAEAGLTDELSQLLLDLDWMQARLRVHRGFATPHTSADVTGLLDDYHWLQESPDLNLVERALRLSGHVLRQWPNQLAAQLYGRMGTSASPVIGLLCVRAKTWLQCCPLFPTSPALQVPGALLHTLVGHSGEIDGALLLADGRRTLSWSSDSTLRLWDLETGDLLQSLVGHQKRIYGAHILSDGCRVLSWSEDSTLRLWDLETGSLLQTLAGHTGLIHNVQILTDGCRVLSWSEDGTLRLWKIDTGTLLHTMPTTSWLQRIVGHISKVEGALFLANGHRVLSWADDHKLKLWDLESGKLLHDLDGHAGKVRGVKLMANGQRAISWSDDATIRVWDLESGTQLLTLSGHDRTVSAVHLLADGRRILSCSDDTLRLWDLESGALLQTTATPECPFDPLMFDERHAVSWSFSGMLHLWDLGAARLVQTLAGHESYVKGAQLLSDSRRALSWSEDRTLRLWDLKTVSQLQTLAGHEGWVNGAKLLSNDRYVLSWSRDATLRLWELQAGNLLQDPARHDGSILGAQLLADDRQVISWSRDHSLRLWDLAMGAPLRTLPMQEEQLVMGIALLADARRALTWSEDETLRLTDLETGTLLYTLAGHEGNVVGALLLDDDRRALSWSEDQTLRLWCLETGTLLQTLSGHENWVYGAELLADGWRALSWSFDETLRLWNMETGELLQTLVGHDGFVLGAQLLPDGRHVLSWSDDETLRLWDLETGTLIRTLGGHQGTVYGAQPLAGGRRALSWSKDETLRLWDLETGALIRTLGGHQGPVYGAQVLADGRRALSWSDDDTLRLWDLENAQCLALYAADAILSPVVVSPDERRIFAGDSLGHVHFLELHCERLVNQS